jgi:acyl-[acyl-carrier-protein]-phospholipid O-acyltransferase / long-chain-fatty-acid--[acyl-carrier-protein] ligase
VRRAHGGGMFRTLMTARRFAPLFWCQFLSAFNDNFVRQMLAMLILFRFGAEDAGAKISLAVAIFVLPSIPLSAIGGEFADAHDKAWVARRMKLIEIGVQMIAAAGFVLGSLNLLYLALFGLGCISALFGPVKYGILPDHLHREELIAGNALVEGATFAAIICGLVVGGYAAAEGRSSISVVLQLAIVAIACYVTSRYIPPTGVGAPNLRVNYNPFTATWRLLRELKADDRSWVGCLAVSWFWTAGAITLSLVPVIVKSRVGGGVEVATAINLFFAIGIAIGSLSAAALAHGRIELAPTPFMLIIMGLIAIHLGFFTGALPLSDHEVGLSAFFTSSVGVEIATEIVAYSFAAGLFVVPIFAAVQAWSSEDRRARIIGANNTLNAIYMVLGSIAVTIILKLTGADETRALAALGVANILAAIYFFRRLPTQYMPFLLRLLWKVAFRLEVRGLENLPPAGTRNVIAVNHVSFLDAPLILSLIDSPPIFAIDHGIAQRWWIKPFLAMADARPLDPMRPLATRAMIQEVQKNKRLVIFPEGRITVTGSLMKVYDGAAMIAEKSEALVTPVRLEGPERTPFSRLDASQIGRRWFPKIVITILPAQRITLDPELKGRARRHAAGAALYDIMSDLIFETSDYELNLHEAFERGLRQRGFPASRAVTQDPVSGEVSASRFRIGVALIARKIAALTRPGETIGLLLPNANGSAVAFMAVQSGGRVAAMLNFTAGPFNLIAAAKMSQARIVLSSHAFVEKGKLEGLVKALEAHVTFVWLEDLRDHATTSEKLLAWAMRGKALARPSPHDPAVVLFTSGSEGAPKGVVLTHVNLLANCAQVAARFDFTPADVMFNPLPIFHAFGLTGGMLLGLVSGFKIYLYPTPLHYRQIPELIYGVNATALLGADTFLAGYAKMANAYDFRSLRYIVCGAEPVKAETRRVYMEKFGLRIFEGYGVTETSPVLAVNTPMFNRNGSVGRLMPGMEHRIEPIPGIDKGGRLHVRGPNVMAGYYRIDNPGKLEPPQQGWYDTGDIVEIAADGFARILGRAKRFAKIGGEIVSLAAVEALTAGLWPDNPPFVIAAPDPKKGERLIMATTKSGATRAEVQAWLKAKGASELMAPALVVTLDEIPLLGSGKTDYVKLAEVLMRKVG